ncbi:MAG: tetratricopeptide repeat protein [Rubinisphaera brasiliensis]|uniref:tetratricopeptide repeat protein n=1 Tax=Rubinisphaera brasiliensis TaxID=119 RepID=UPI00391DCC85
MALDPYSLCPCGSGKKLKFCCADIAPEMMKALQLHEAGQSRAALKILERLHTQDPARSWVATSLAGVQLFLEDPAAARDALKPLLAESPDHPLGRVLDATAALDLNGFEGARSVIHRAFTKSVKTHPEMVGSLAAGIASLLYDQDKFLAARQHLALAMRFVREEDRQSVFMRMLDLDGEQSIAYPLRGVHNLKALDLTEDQKAIYKKAISLSAIGCWHEAATLLQPLLDAQPDNTDLAFNIALFHAWDGNHGKAAELLHQSAANSQDREFAIGAETLAQTLDLEQDKVADEVLYLPVDSVSRLLTQLDDEPRLIRTRQQERSPEDQAVTQFIVLDAESPEPPTSLASWDDVASYPKVVGGILAFDRDPEDETSQPFVRITLKPDQAEETRKFLISLKFPIDTADLPDSEMMGGGGYQEWRDYRTLYSEQFLPEATPGHLRALAESLKWQHIVGHRWLDRPLTALDGKTPREAKDIPEMSVKLAAAVNVFDAFANKFNYALDTDALKSSLGLPASEPFRIEQDSQLNSCDVLQMLRIDVESLTEQQLALLINRAQLIQHPRFNERLLASILKFPNIVEPQRMTQILHAYIDLARDSFDQSAALERIELARQWSKTTGQKFEDTLQWELRELQFRILEPEKDDFVAFLNNLHERFLRKLPELEQLIEGLLSEHQITPPWKSAAGIASAGEQNSGGLWSPETQQQPASSGKLWLPGQE